MAKIQVLDVTAFSTGDAKAENAALVAALPMVAPTIKGLAVGQRSTEAKAWAYNWKRNKTWATVPDSDGKAYASHNAWIRGYFAIAPDDAVTFDKYQNAIDHLARAGAKDAGATEKGKAKRSALDSLRAAVGTFLAPSLADKANHADVKALIRQMQRDYTKAVEAADVAPVVVAPVVVNS